MSIVGIDGKIRCFGGSATTLVCGQYHDTEWGIPVHGDRLLFEMLILEGVQAGLSWSTVLKKRQAYKDLFYNFDVHRIAVMTDEQLAMLCSDGRIIRNRLKIWGTRRNAQIFIRIVQEYGTFDAYLWSFVGYKPVVNAWHLWKDVPKTTHESDSLSKDLKKRGMTFVGSTIIYAYMQGVGLVDDHLITCFKRIVA